MHNDTKEISKSTTIYFGANFITKAAAFFLIPVYTIFFSPEEYGILNIISITANFIFIFIILGLKGAIQRFSFDFSDRDVRQRKFFGIITLFTFLTGLSLSIFLTVFGDKIFPVFFKDVPFSPFLLIAVWIAFFRIFHQIKLAIFQIRQQAFFYTLLDSGFILANILLTIVVVVFLKKGLTGKIYLDLILISVFSIVSLVLLVKDIKINFEFKQLKAPLKYSLPLIPHMLSGFLLAAIDRIFLERMIGLNDVGIYSLAFNIAMILYLFIDAIRLSYTPYFNKTALKEGDKAKSKFAKITTYGFLIYTLVGIFLIIFSKELITLIADKKYHGAVDIFPVIIITNVINGLYFFFVRPLLFLKNNTHFVSIATVIAAIINIFLNYFFISYFGILGAAWATFISILIKVGLIFYFAQQKYLIKYEYKRIFILMCSISAAVVCFVFFEYLEFEIFSFIALKIFVFILFISILFFVNFFDKDEFLFAKNILHGIKNKYMTK